MTRLGCLVMILAVIFFVASLATPQVFAPLAPLFCTSGEQLASDKVGYSTPTESGYQIQFTCVSKEGKPRDVSTEVTLAMTATFLVLLFGGIALTSVGATRSRNTQQTTLSSTPAVQPQLVQASTPIMPRVYTMSTTTTRDPNALNPNLNDIMDGLNRGVIRFGGQEVSIADLKSGAYQHVATVDSKRSLAETLRQLEDAHKQSLINDDEYQHLRQEALDKLV